MDNKPLSEIFGSMVKDQLGHNTQDMMINFTDAQRNQVNEILSKALQECYLVINKDCKEFKDFHRTQVNTLDLLEHVAATTHAMKKYLMEILNITEVPN